MIITFQTFACATTEADTLPAFVPAEPNTHWFDAVAVASRPKINEPLKLPVCVLYPNPVLLLPVELLPNALLPNAVLLLPVVLENNAVLPIAVFCSPEPFVVNA